MVQCVHLDRHSEDAAGDAPVLELDWVHSSVDGVAPRAVLVKTFALEVLDEGATERNVEHLHPAAHSEHRELQFDGSSCERDLHAIAMRIDTGHRLVGILAVPGRVDVTATGQDERVRMVEHLD